MAQQGNRGDQRLLERIGEMVALERDLRTMLAEGRIDAESEHARLKEVQEELDQAWDLLRQRRAREDAGEDPDRATIRSIEEVERYES